MTETSEHVADFEAYLTERDLTPDAYQAMPEEMRQYIWETWQCEHKIIAPLPAAADDEDKAASEAPAASTAVVSVPQAAQHQAVARQSQVDWLTRLTFACALLMVVLSVILFTNRPKAPAGPPVVDLSPTVTAPDNSASIQPAVNGPSGSPTVWQVVGRADQQSPG